MPIERLRYIGNFVTKAEESQLLAAIDGERLLTLGAFTGALDQMLEDNAKRSSCSGDAADELRWRRQYTSAASFYEYED